MSSQIIAVVGATGNQGSGVVSAVLSSTPFPVRALTTDPSSDHAKALLAKHQDAVDAGKLTLVQADLNDVDSLKKAVEGAQAVFGMTTPTAEEVQQGRNLVDAVKAAGVQHFIWSGLPSVGKLSGGKFPGIFYFETKAVVEAYAKEQLEHVTVLYPGGFYSNMAFPWYTQRKPDGTFRVCLMSKNPDPAVGWTDPTVDLGVFAAAVLNKPLSLTSGKTYPVMSLVKTGDLIKHVEERSGVKAVWEPLSGEELHAMLGDKPHGDMLEAAASDMFNFIDSTPAGTTCYGMYTRADDPSLELGVKASSFGEWLDRSGWKP
ncbi:hypothetical protein JCM10450v2_005408 [Rhodotorula kratochvilovae]